MSADRYEIDMHDDGTFIITNLNGHRFIVDANCVDIRSRAIRQQARDIAELRAERDRLRADLPAAEMDGVKLNNRYRVMMLSLNLPAAELRQMASRIAAEGDYEIAELKHECRKIEQEFSADLDKLRTDLAAAVARAEQAESRLAAIDGAPTVGWLRPYGRGLSTSEPSGERMPQYELIARPAKD